MGFWEDVDQALAGARSARTAAELVAALNLWHAPSCGDAFFGGSGGDDQLCDALNPAFWQIEWLDGDIYWRAVSNIDRSTVEYVEGDVYRR